MLLLSPAQFILRLVIAVFLPVIIIGNYLTSLVFGMLSLPFVVFSRLQVFYSSSISSRYTIYPIISYLDPRYVGDGWIDGWVD